MPPPSARGKADSAGYDPILTASTRSLGDKVEIRIRDNGAGIPPEVREKMFNPFFTTKPAGEGTGLGLSISHDIIVKQHLGSIEVDTEPGAFTEFRDRSAACNGFALKPDEARCGTIVCDARHSGLSQVLKHTVVMAVGN